MQLRVHLLQEDDRIFLKHLAKFLRKDIVFACGETLPDQPDYDVLVCGVPTKESIEASPRLKHLVIPWAGLPKKTRRLMLDYPEISVHNIHHNAVPAAETAMALMLALARKLIPTDASLRENDWRPRYETGGILLMAGKRAVILGYGAIGREIASRCLAFDMQVSVVNNSGVARDAKGVELFPKSALEGLLSAADVLFVSLPLTQDTEGLLGAEQLSKLPDGAIVINVSRGAIIDEKALYDSLKSGKINAGLDVWYNYPGSVEARAATPPSQYPFHELPNVIMTPHLAGHSDRTEILRARAIADLLNPVPDGARMANRVDLSRGY